jgi:hypothetical protein
MAAQTPTPTDGLLFPDYTRGTGETWDSLPSTISSTPGVVSVKPTDPGGINANEDGSGHVTLSTYIPAANSAFELPGAGLPANQAQVILAFRRDLGKLQVYDPVTATWITV